MALTNGATFMPLGQDRGWMQHIGYGALATGYASPDTSSSMAAIFHGFPLPNQQAGIWNQSGWATELKKFKHL